MFFRKTKVALNESTIASIELCRQAIMLIIGTNNFIIKTVMKIETENLDGFNPQQTKVTVSTKFLYQNKLFDINFEAMMVKKDFWFLMEGVYIGKAIINKKYNFFFTSGGYLKFNLLPYQTMHSDLFLRN